MFVITAPIWAAALSIAYVWGADPYGPAMMTAYIVAAIASFFAIILDSTS